MVMPYCLVKGEEASSRGAMGVKRKTQKISERSCNVAGPRKKGRKKTKFEGVGKRGGRVARTRSQRAVEEPGCGNRVNERSQVANEEGGREWKRRRSCGRSMPRA